MKSLLTEKILSSGEGCGDLHAVLAYFRIVQHSLYRERSQDDTAPALEFTTSVAHCWDDGLSRPDEYILVQTAPEPSKAAAVDGAFAIYTVDHLATDIL